MKLLLAICLATLFVLGVHQHFAESGISGNLPITDGQPNSGPVLTWAVPCPVGSYLKGSGTCSTPTAQDIAEATWCNGESNAARAKRIQKAGAICPNPAP